MYDINRKKLEENIYTEADKDPLESLVRGGLQVEQGELVVGAVLRFMTNGLEQSRCTVQLWGKNKILCVTHTCVDNKALTCPDTETLACVLSRYTETWRLMRAACLDAALRHGQRRAADLHT